MTPRMFLKNQLHNQRGDLLRKKTNTFKKCYEFLGIAFQKLFFLYFFHCIIFIYTILLFCVSAI